jgi:hypothetical protein
MMHKKLLALTIILLSALYSHAQEEWKLKTDKDNIKIYSKSTPESKVKSLKVVCSIDARLTQLAAVLLDINATTEWVYKTKSAIVQKQISPSEVVYYSEIDMPWPLSNRDFVVRIKVSQNPVTKVVTVETENLPDYLPEKKDIVRVKHSEAKWIFKPLPKNQVLIEYTLVVDPGGSIPTWLVNMFSTKGPFECFKNLKAQINKPVYVKAKLPFVVD